MNKLDKIELEAQRAREKIAAMQSRLKEIGDQRVEQENLQIVQQVRALKLSRDELYAFLRGGDMPASLTGVMTSPAAPEPIYSRRERTRQHEPENTEITNMESEGINNEE